MKIGRFLVFAVLGLFVLAGCAAKDDKMMAKDDKMMAKDDKMMAKEKKMMAKDDKMMAKDKKMMPKKSLYERLGGKEAITAVVDNFLKRVAADTRINRYFAKANIPRLKTRLVNQICEASGGPCTYTGRDMKTAHGGMGITNVAFYALINDLSTSLKVK